ncbi:MAG TPA: VOC family protein [Desulfomonilaceae bacterium]|nr:VOC family protein [Desulfomonilaceae bacterium]
MITQAQPVLKPAFSIPATTRLGYVHLTVANLDRQIKFYESVLGMQVHWREGASAGLGAGENDLLRLTEVKGARRPGGTTGLYHFALRYPNRKELARATARLFALRYPNSPTDHTVSESIYLEDPEGQTIELYILTLERGTIQAINGNLYARRSDGKPATGRDPLDVEDLLRELSPEDRLDLPLPQGTSLGHVNLYEANLADTIRFYHDVLGFERGPVSTSFHMGEVGLSAERPHVIAFNTWMGEGAPTPPANALGIRFYTIELPDQAEFSRVLARVQQAGIAVEETEEGILVRDPGSIGVVLTTTNYGKGA